MTKSHSDSDSSDLMLFPSIHPHLRRFWLLDDQVEDELKEGFDVLQEMLEGSDTETKISSIIPVIFLPSRSTVHPLCLAHPFSFPFPLLPITHPLFFPCSQSRILYSFLAPNHASFILFLLPNHVTRPLKGCFQCCLFCTLEQT